MLKTLIFDLDGVLVRASWEGVFEAYKALIKAGGKDYRDFFCDLAEFKEWWKPNWRENEKRIQIQDVTKTHGIFYRVYAAYAHQLPFMDSVLEKLSRKYTLTIFSSRHRYEVEKLLAAAADRFDIIVGAEDVEDLKPSPEGIYLILNTIQTPPETALMLGDMPEDLLAGHSAGTKTGAVIWEYGLGTEANFAELSFKPDYVFRSAQCFLRQLL
jgi:HAD superfamily hydrolase (TIGR01549 family)